jgi:hypothetical protein
MNMVPFRSSRNAPRAGRRPVGIRAAGLCRTHVDYLIIPPPGLGRRLRDEDTPLGLSTVYRLLTDVRATLPAELLVRFEGVAGEFAQLDFGAAR